VPATTLTATPIAFKWEFVGGAPAYAAVETSQTTASAALVDLTTVGPSFTVPRAGDYLFRYNVDVGNNGAGNTDIVGLMKNGVEADRMVQQIVGAGGVAAPMREIQLTGLAASDAFKLQYLRHRRHRHIPAAAADRYPNPSVRGHDPDLGRGGVPD
jgi:hypothetical protein